MSPLGDSGGISQSSLLTKLTNVLKEKSTATQTSASSLEENVGERIDISSDQNLNFLRVEACVLKNDLSGLITDSFLTPLRRTLNNS